MLVKHWNNWIAIWKKNMVGFLFHFFFCHCCCTIDSLFLSLEWAITIKPCWWRGGGERVKCWDFSGSPVVKTPHFKRRVHKFHPWSGNRDPTCCMVQPLPLKKSYVLPIFIWYGFWTCMWECLVDNWLNESGVAGRTGDLELGVITLQVILELWVWMAWGSLCCSHIFRIVLGNSSHPQPSYDNRCKIKKEKCGILKTLCRIIYTLLFLSFPLLGFRNISFLHSPVFP